MSEIYQTQIMTAINDEDSDTLKKILTQYQIENGAFPIFDFFMFLRAHIINMSCQDFLREKSMNPKKYKKILWLQETLKDTPYVLSVLLSLAYIHSYKNELNEAAKLYRIAFAHYMKSLQQTGLQTPLSNTWFWFLNYALFNEPTIPDGQGFALEKLQLPETLTNSLPEETLITAYGNAPYIMRYAKRFIEGIREFCPDIHILLVAGDADDECKNYCETLQSENKGLHIAYEKIDKTFQTKNFLHTYCSLRRFTYIDDIFEKIGNQHLITLDLDLFINDNLNHIIDDMKSVSIGYESNKNSLFTCENVFSGRFLKFDNSKASQRMRYHLSDYLRKKLHSSDLIWIVDQNAIFHAWQVAKLTREEKSLCRNLKDIYQNSSHLHIGITNEEKQLFDEDRDIKMQDSRLALIVLPQHIRFDDKTLKPIINWDKIDEE